MPTMNVNLTEDLADFVTEQTRRGGYANQSEVVRDGLRLLRSQAAKRRALLRALRAGRNDVEDGRVVEMTDEFLRGIAAGVQKRQKGRSGKR